MTAEGSCVSVGPESFVVTASLPLLRRCFAGLTPMLLIRLEVDSSTGCEIQALGSLSENLFLSYRN